MAYHAIPSPPLTPPTTNEAVDAATPENSTYVTLVTKESYLPGVLVLTHSLQRAGSNFGLLILTTPSLPESSRYILELECMYNKNIQVKTVQSLYPPSQAANGAASDTNGGSAAERFADTYTKLRTFELLDYHTIVFVDADILCLQNPDALFSMPFPSGIDFLATPVCACNLDCDTWCPPSWIPANCAHTHQSYPSALKSPPMVPHSALGQSSPNGALEPQRQLNSGVFVFHPSRSLSSAMQDAFATDQNLRSYTCPDQDFLTVFFRDRWAAVPWQYNALKTMRYWHANIWAGDANEFRQGSDDGEQWRATGDDDIAMLHYIVDKPWAERIASDGIAGHLGRDSATHRRWWDAYELWRRDRLRSEGEEKATQGRARVLVEEVDGLVAPQLDEDEDRRQCEENADNDLPKTITYRDGMSEVARKGSRRIWDGVSH